MIQKHSRGKYRGTFAQKRPCERGGELPSENGFNEPGSID